jgi:hypothetical protein
MKIGAKYNWIGQAEKLVYLGRAGVWHQFALIDEPEKIWCEVLTEDLRMIEETKNSAVPGFEDIDLAPWIDELLAEAIAGNHTANILYEIADKMAKGQNADIGEAAFLLGYIKSQQALRADLGANK